MASKRKFRTVKTKSATRAGRPTQAERFEARRAERRKTARRNRLLVVVPIALVAALVIGGIAFARWREGRRHAELQTGTCRYDSNGERGQEHVSSPTFVTDPPSGGDHTANVAGPRFYDEPPEDGPVVHALEHGYIAIWYQPRLPARQVAELQKLFDRSSKDVLVIPRRSLQVQVAATAWGRRLLCQEVEPATLARFVELYVNRGPEKVPH